MASLQSGNLQTYTSQIRRPNPSSRKGENGKLLIIGGSELFHAASAWSLDVASRIVDMVFYSSVPSNNEMIDTARRSFWDGIVVPREQLDPYLEESNAILIGPGMDRSDETKQIVDQLVERYPTKRWILDAGALQMIDKTLLFEKVEQAILTPHAGEFEHLFELPATQEHVQTVADQHPNFVILRKGPVDVVAYQDQLELVEGGHAGMTKGGTGDVLAGLVAGLATTSPIFASAVIASVVNKSAGERLATKKAEFFNATDLVSEVSEILAEMLHHSS